MSEYTFKINEKDSERIVECMKRIADVMAKHDIVSVTTESVDVEKNFMQDGKEICTMEIAEMFGWQHVKVFNMISKYIAVNAEAKEKKEFRFEERVYKQGIRKHAVCYLTTAGCHIFLDKICAGEIRKSKKFVEGAEKLRRAMEGEGRSEQYGILMNGRSRTECQKIKELFDRFIAGPALENREIAELSEKYRVFHTAMKEVALNAKENNKIEGAVYDVAIEAEMQGFIYGFKLYEELLKRSLAVV